MPATVDNDAIFRRAQEIVAHADNEQLLGNETIPETVQRLAFDKARLEHELRRDEYDTS